SAERLANFLREEIKAFEKQIDETIKTDTMLKQNAKLLSSIPGLGKKSVAWLLAYLGDGSRFKNGKAAAAYAGLTPMHHQSGSSINGKPRISKIGQTDIRKILFMPAVAYSFGNYKDRIYKTFVDNLLAKGKDKKVIIVALMRKLVAIAQTVLKNQMPFDASLHQKTM
ncbi:transposase, partial [Phocoenobacter skyensis]